MRHVIEQSGHEPAGAITRKHIVAGRDRRTPAQAKHFLATMRGLFAWAIDAGHVKSDPTAEVKNTKMKKTAGFPIWSEEEVDRYEAHWPIGTKERVWLAVLLYTGFRRGDAVRLGRQHVRNGVATLRTEKTDTIVHHPGPTRPRRDPACRPQRRPRLHLWRQGQAAQERVLREHVLQSLQSRRCDGEVGSWTQKGRPTRAANNGATVAELEAISGWQGGRMAALYTEAANRVRLAKGAMAKIEAPPAEENENRTSIPSPRVQVRD
jgi:integrase